MTICYKKQACYNRPACPPCFPDPRAERACLHACLHKCLHACLTQARALGSHRGHTHIGHNYIGHDCTGHNYINAGNKPTGMDPGTGKKSAECRHAKYWVDAGPMWEPESQKMPTRARRHKTPNSHSPQS